MYVTFIYTEFEISVPTSNKIKIHLFTVICWLILVGEMVVVFSMKVYRSLI